MAKTKQFKRRLFWSWICPIPGCRHPIRPHQQSQSLASKSFGLVRKSGELHMEKCHPGIDLPPILIEKNNVGKIIYDETEEVKKLMEERGYGQIRMPGVSVRDQRKVVTQPVGQ
jgi:hypothetical protein